MSTIEYVFAVIGILIIVGGFAYGIYDTYFQSKNPSSSDSDPDWYQLTDAILLSNMRYPTRGIVTI